MLRFTQIARIKRAPNKLSNFTEYSKRMLVTTTKNKSSSLALFIERTGTVRLVVVQKFLDKSDIIQIR